MGHPFLHPSGRALLKQVAHYFRSAKVFVSRDHYIIFVCGGTAGGCMRERFVTYARAELKGMRVFLAEDAQRDFVTYEEPEFVNIAEFEEVIAQVADCVIIFPESAGSYAELGYFAKHEEIRRKLLIVNNGSLQGEDSFISIGPIELINAHSLFRTTIQMDFSSCEPPFHLVKQRLEQRIPASANRRKRFEYKKYKDLGVQEKMFVVMELINIFQALTLDGVEYAIKSIFRNKKRAEVKRFLSVLVSANYIRRAGDSLEYFVVNRRASSFMEFDGPNINELRLAAVDHYEKHHPGTAGVVRGLSG